jgi:Cu/Zn superoxide dismutase
MNKLALAAIPLALALSCTPKAPARSGAQAPRVVTAAIVDMYPVSRSDVHGLLHFRALEHGLLLRGNVTGLKAGMYGLGIRENGDCSAFDGRSSGDIFVGGAHTREAPLGRLDNLVIEHDGDTNVDRVESSLTLSGVDAIVGKSLVIEYWAYDPKVDPNKIPFAACGVIRGE